MRLVRGDIELLVAPETGGSVSAFRWRGIPIFRDAPAHNRNVLESGNYPLVPYSNRIAFARFGSFQASPNFPEIEPLHLIHGTGFLASWEVLDAGHLRHAYAGPGWPGPFTAEQRFELHDDGYTHHLSIRNDCDTAIPAGLGLHPHFTRAGARLDITLDGKWINDKNRIPERLEPLTTMPDWFNGDPIDNGFTGRKGDIHIHWPSHSLTMRPDDALSHTVIYCPPGGEFFCVEPVTHMIDAANRHGTEGMRLIAPGECWSVKTRFRIS
jgi:aldose 1-epimerase